jgi:CelD/BcsL family acetyltransferase involved in cellulose biosynthesis
MQASSHRDVNRDPGPLLLEPIGSLDGTPREEWNSLASSTRNIFATWEWNSVWWKHFGRSKKLLLSACRSEDGRIVALLPLYLWRRYPFRIVRFLGHHGGDQLGPICLPHHRQAVAEALARALSHQADVFVGERLACEEGWSALLPARELGKEASPVLRFSVSSWEGFLQSRSRNFREQARRRERKLAESHEVRYRLADDPEQLQSDLDTLFQLHSARWDGKPTGFSTREAFHRDFATYALERGWLRLWFLDVDGEPRAACYGFRFGDVESFYQSGRDPSWNQYSVGFIILLHSIREALADGMTEYRLLRGDEPYKFRFANEDNDLETIAIARTWGSRFALTIAETARRSSALRKVLASWHQMF